MNPDMKEFLTKLADLMEEYNAEINVSEDGYGVPDGVSFEINRKLERGKDWDLETIPETQYITEEDFRMLLNAP